ncbi:MAG TPA: hypothetical protein VNN80_29755, partial [Polyangiaceae bacterium]|nr:hypothetical protein [Polyangiaceae bacterium]
LAHHIIGQGRAAYRRAFIDPLSAAEHIEALTPETGLYGLGLFRYDALRFEAQKLRLIEAFTFPHDAAEKRQRAERLRARNFEGLARSERFALSVAFRVSGYFHVLSAIRAGFEGPRFEPEHSELYPRFVEDASGEIRVAPQSASSDAGRAERATVPWGPSERAPKARRSGG